MPPPVLTKPNVVAEPLEMLPVTVLMPVFAPPKVSVTLVVPPEIGPPKFRVLVALALPLAKV